MKLLELFSGIGGFALGLQRAGFEFSEHYFSEIDKSAIANYKHNFKNAKYIGSVTDIRGTDFTGIDIITFGSPCQDFSLAGKRKGLEGERSSLIGEAIRLIDECRPSVFIWENVKGAFSSNNSEDFWAIIQAFTNIGGYIIEWQLLNTKWFLPQNRERIYLIGHLANRSIPGIFPIGEDGELFNKAKRYKREEREWFQATNFSGTITNNGFCRNTDTYVKVGTWRTHKDGNGFRTSENNISPTLPARARTDGSGQVVIRQHPQCFDKIRRLTEIECERLQGFPDDWTRYGNYDGKIQEISKSQRYKMIGNAVTVDVVAEIGKRLKITYH
ncbi:DNA cytosine methyltransferase [Riemerella anatipestifer]|nr:DNA cytosine methyltransferase [Riemerella anatipestifer]